MHPINIEKLLSHSIGISNSYYRPTENELLEDYLKVADLLCIDKTNKLQEQLNEYTEKNNEHTYIIKGKLQEKDEQIKSLSDQVSSMKNMIESLVKGLSETKDQQQVNSVTHSLFSSGVIKKID